MSIIVPAYNEEQRIEACLSRLTKLGYDIIVVADGCTDRTVEIAKQFNCVVVFPPKRLGKGGGFFAGLSYCKREPIFMIDTDLPVPLENLAVFEKALGKDDIVIAERIEIHDSTLIRKIYHLGFKLFCKIFFHWNIRDSQCGFKAFDRKVLDYLSDKMVTHGFAFDVEMLIRAEKAGFKIKQIPVKWTAAKKGKVSVQRHILEMFKDLIKILTVTYKVEDLTSFQDQ